MHRKKTVFRVSGIVGLLLAFAGPTFCQQPPAGVGVEEHLGAMVPGDLTFRDESGKPLRLGDLLDRPVILNLVFFQCPDICRPLMLGLSDTLGQLDLAPLQDYRIVTVSFNEDEKPDLASETKAGIFARLKAGFPEKAWIFLTGDKPEIDRLTAAVGFRFQRRGMGFVHPAVLTFLAPGGKISRYLYGISYLPFDLKLGLIEAAKGRVGASINRILYFCFSYQSGSKAYVFNFLKVAGALILFFLALFAIVLLFVSRRRHREKTA